MRYLLIAVILVVLIIDQSFGVSVTSTIYGPSATLMDSVLGTISLKHQPRMLASFGYDSVMILIPAPTTTTRFVYTTNGGTGWTTTAMSSAWSTASQPNALWLFKDSGAVVELGASSTRTARMYYIKGTSFSMDTCVLPGSRSGNRNNTGWCNQICGITANGDSLIIPIRPETGTTDTCIPMRSLGAWTQTVTLDTITRMAGTTYPQLATVCPIPYLSGIMWWVGGTNAADQLTILTTKGSSGKSFDTLSSALTGVNNSGYNTGLYQWTQDMIATGDSTFCVAYQDNGGALYARPFRVDRGAGIGGYVAEAVAAATTIEADADLIAPDLTTAHAYEGLASPKLSRVMDTDTILLYYWYWSNQSYIDSVSLVFKMSTDRGSTWGARTTAISSANIDATKHHLGFQITPSSKSKTGNLIQSWAYWTDSLALNLDSARLAKIVINNSTSSGFSPRRRRVLGLTDSIIPTLRCVASIGRFWRLP